MSSRIVDGLVQQGMVKVCTSDNQSKGVDDTFGTFGNLGVGVDHKLFQVAMNGLIFKEFFRVSSSE